ncbi:MAG: outer membrane beta-barrel protein [Bacteroidota bacterium]
MKHSIISICFIALTISFADAQIVRTYGFNIGYVHAKQNWDYSPQLGFDPHMSGTISGIGGGAFVEFLDIPYFSLLTKVQYIQKGRTITVMETMVSSTNPNGYVDIGMADIKYRLNYISVPILAKLRIETPICVPYLAIGPRFEYLISYPSNVVYDEFKKMEVTGTVAVGMEFSLGFIPKFLLEADYNTSLTNSFNNGSLIVSDNSVEVLCGIFLK